MGDTTSSLSHEELAALCGRAFPDRAQQTVAAIRTVSSRQHEMTAFDLWWVDGSGAVLHEGLMVRRYVSTLSWWRPDDRGKAQREATVCRWLYEQGFPVPAVYAREFSPQGDLVLFSRLPADDLSIEGRTLREAVEPYLGAFARLLAELHAMDPPDSVRQVVPQVTLPGALANLTAVAFQIGQPDLQDAIQQVMRHAYDVPQVEPVLVHGDYHLLNALLGNGTVVGIVDWEYAALGDPRWDVANAYMQLVDFDAAEAADLFLETYLRHSGRQFEGPPLHNAVAALQQWAISEWLVQQEREGRLPDFGLAHDLVRLRDVHRHRAETAMQWLP
jgi:aminoglycoside phosphotransferase